MKHCTRWALGATFFVGLTALPQPVAAQAEEETATEGSAGSAGVDFGASAEGSTDTSAAEPSGVQAEASAEGSTTSNAPANSGDPSKDSRVAAAEGEDKPAGEEEQRFSASEASKGISSKVGDWTLTLYGFAALNGMWDSTQSFGTGLHNNIMQRPGTFRGDHDQFQFTVRDSRFGLRVGAPPTRNVKATATVEMDFNGLQPVEFTEHDRYVMNPLRMRHYYMLIETPVVDVLAGQYHDLLGWGGKGFFPNTLAFLGLTGQVYHRQPQLRVSKTLGGRAMDFEIATAATRPAHNAAGLPDFQAGLRLAFNDWTGARAQGYGQPGIGPVAVGVSGIMRRFEVAEFVATPGESRSDTGFGFAVNAFLPVIPAKTPEKRSNALSLTGEFSNGEGIGDLYTELSGGLLFPTLPNPSDAIPPPVYPQNIDSGFVTFDGNGELKMVKWQGLVVNLQYYLPILDGKIWISGTFSQIRSSNLKVLTPLPARGAIYTRSDYIDGNLFVALTDQLQVGLSFQTVQQTFGDGIKGRNNRGEGAIHFFF